MKLLSFSILLGLIISSCSNEANKLLKEIDYREREIAKVVSSPHDNKKDNFLLIETYEDFLKDHSSHPVAGDVKFKLAQSWIKIHKNDKACKLLGELYDEYPNYERRVEALFLKAFISETELNRKESALKIYQTIVEKHPEHELAKDAKLMLQK